MRLIALFIVANSALAQNPASPAFEVASVKINREFHQDDRSTWRSKVDISRQARHVACALF